MEKVPPASTMTLSPLGQSHVLLCLLYVAMTTIGTPPGIGAVTMSTPGQIYVLNAGQSVQMDCEFLSHEFNMFDNPVIWKKSQKGEETQLNIMGNIFQPFLSTGRYEVAFTEEAPRFCLKLTLLNVFLEDSGNYTCEVRGRRSSVLAKVMHYVFIRAAVDDVILYTDNATYRSPSSSSVKVISFVKGVAQAVGCVSRGGYPPPQITLYMDDLDVTAQFSLGHASSLEGVRGLRLMRNEVLRWTGDLKVETGDDGRLLRCRVTVPGLATRSTSSIVVVSYGPIINCRQGVAFLDESNVNLVCEVRSRPGLSRLFWIVDQTDQTLTVSSAAARPADHYWSIVMDRNDGVIETRLFMRRATPDAFRTYSVVAENSIATTTEKVQLLRRFESSTFVPPFIRNGIAKKPDVINDRKREQEQEPKVVRINPHVHDNSATPGIWRYINTPSAGAGSSVSMTTVAMATAFTLTICYVTSRR